LSISPASPTVGIGVQAGLQLTVSATDSKGNIVPVPPNLQWNPSNPAIATVTSPGGVVYGVAIGSAAVNVSDPVSGASASVVVAVGQNTISPSTATLTLDQ